MRVNAFYESSLKRRAAVYTAVEELPGRTVWSRGCTRPCNETVQYTRTGERGSGYSRYGHLSFSSDTFVLIQGKSAQ